MRRVHQVSKSRFVSPTSGARGCEPTFLEAEAIEYTRDKVRYVIA